MGAVWRDAPYDKGDLLVLLALADQANAEGICWPSIPTVAARTRLHPRTVQKIIRRLQSDGALKVQDGGFVSGKNTTNTYQLTMRWQNATGAGAHEMPPGGAPEATGGGGLEGTTREPSSSTTNEPSTARGASESP